MSNQKIVAETLSVSFGITSICFGVVCLGVPPGVAAAFGIGFGIASLCFGMLCMGSNTL